MQPKLIKRFWAVMITKYSSAWIQSFGSKPFDENGKLTILALEWSAQLADVSPEQIKGGIEKLPTRTNNDFPPNAMSFKKLCQSGNASYDEVLDEILTFIGRSSNEEFWWQTREAYSVYMMLHHNKVNPMTSYEIADKTKRIYSCLDFSSLLELPPKPKTLKQISKPVDDKTWQMKKRDFQRRMSHSIARIKPDLFINPKGSTSEASPAMKKLFSSFNTQKLMTTYEKGKYMSMDKFLTDQGIFK